MTGYVAHYSDGVTDWVEPVSSTHLHVVNLTSGLTYIFTVETLSEHLSGESDPSTISLSKTLRVCVEECSILALSPLIILVFFYLALYHNKFLVKLL